MSNLQETIHLQREALSHWLHAPMSAVAAVCGEMWDSPDRLERVLAENLPRLTGCSLVYALDVTGLLVSGNVGPDGIDRSVRGDNLSSRPYLQDAVPCGDSLLVSEIYISRHGNRACVTALRTVAGPGGVLGFVAADFELSRLPLPNVLAEPENRWCQLRGDPAIRGALFQQRRVHSGIDAHAEAIIAIMDELICEHGVFHGKVHYSGNRATLWLTQDPYRYRLHVLDEIVSPEVCLAYPKTPYHPEAVVPKALVRPVFERFRLLREADEVVYLRSGSLNVVNGMVGLNFSCDGTHYMPAQEFLAKSDAFWFGGAA